MINIESETEITEYYFNTQHCCQIIYLRWHRTIQQTKTTGHIL